MLSPVSVFVTDVYDTTQANGEFRPEFYVQIAQQFLDFSHRWRVEQLVELCAVHFQMETITADGYDALSGGSATVEGYPMEWVVQGVDPKKVILEVTTDRFGTSVRDTFVTYVADM